MFMLAWFAVALVALAGFGLGDGLAGAAGWKGLRITGLRPAFVLAIAAVGLCGAVVIAAIAPITADVWAIAGALALPSYFGLALVKNRALTPEPWSTAGTWERHAATAVTIPARDGSIPGLLYAPHQMPDGAIALLHGAGAHKTFYLWPLVEALVDAGFAVCAIDLDGHGDNQRTLDFPSVLENVEATAAWLRKRYTFVGIAGISLGGCIAARAVAEGAQVDALAILESPISVDVTRRVHRHEYWTLLRLGTWRLHRYAGTLPLARSWATRPTHSRISTGELIRRLDLAGSLAQIRAPLWLCYGMSDWVVPMTQVRAIERALRPGTPLVLVPRATHLSLPLDRRALRSLQHWLTEVRQERTRGLRPASSGAGLARRSAAADHRTQRS